MRIIIKLTSKYMKLNRRRTLATIAGICGAMLAVTAFVLFTDTLLGMLRESVAESEGSYHVIFHDITEEQFDQLKKCDKIASCFPVSDCGNAETGLICAKAELKKVNLLIFRRAQSIARDIGMSPLPEDERMVLPDRGKGTYNVTYHMEILKYYGISDTDSAGIGVIMKVILAALIITGWHRCNLSTEINVCIHGRNHLRDYRNTFGYLSWICVDSNPGIYVGRLHQYRQCNISTYGSRDRN